MRVRVDHKADAVYVNLADREIAEREEVADGIVNGLRRRRPDCRLGDLGRVAPDRRSRRLEAIQLRIASRVVRRAVWAGRFEFRREGRFNLGLKIRSTATPSAPRSIDRRYRQARFEIPADQGAPRRLR